MTKTFYFEDAIVTSNPKRECYAVNLIETGVFIEKVLAKMIAEETKEDPILISILLAYIKICRQDGNLGLEREKRDVPPTDGELLASVAAILDRYEIERVIRVFRDLRWHEMKEIIYSGNQAQEMLEKYID